MTLIIVGTAMFFFVFGMMVGAEQGPGWTKHFVEWLMFFKSLLGRLVPK